MAYTPTQVKAINAAREANVRAGRDAHSGAGATSVSVAAGRGGRGTTVPTANINNPNVAFVQPTNVIDAPNMSVIDPMNRKMDFGQFDSILNPTNFTGLNQGLQVSANESLKTFADQKNDVNNNMDNIFSQFLQNESNIKTPSGADSFKQAQKDTGILQKQQIVGDLTGQLNQIVATSQAQQIAETGQGRGIPETIIGGRQAQIAREAAIQALPIAAQLSAAQGNLAMAEQNMNTLFKIYSDDANNQYNRKTKLNESIFSYLTAREKTKLDGIQRQEDRAYEQQDNLIKTQESYAQMALRNNQGGLAGKLMALNPQSPSYKRDFSKLISGISDPMMGLDMRLKQAQIDKMDRETALMGEPTAKELKEEADALKNVQSQNQVLTDKILLVDTLKSSPGMASRVGTKGLNRSGGGRIVTALGSASTGAIGGAFLGPVGAIVGGATGLAAGLYAGAPSDVSGAGQAFSGGVHRLASKEFIDTLINAKSQGATFGALTDREGDALRSAATQLNDWEIKDKNGLGTGRWNIDEASFNAELDRIKSLSQKAIINSTGSILDTNEQSLLNATFNSANSTSALLPANYYQ